ncbi:MAG: glycosyltransferase family 87 protein [Terracidiphilus sp.]
MSRTRRIALFWLMLCCSLSALWGFFLERAALDGMLDFKGVYYDARCMLQHRDPYQYGEPARVFLADQKDHPVLSDVQRQILSLDIYLPTTSIFIAPFAMMPWGLAHRLWMILTAGCLTLAAFLMWDRGAKYAPEISAVLICFILANCEVILAAGNTAGMVVSLCVVAVWCFLRERFVLVGILCLAVSLVIKPHDGGLVWLYFLLAGGVYRKRALQTLLATAVLAALAILWVTPIAPHWMQELQSNNLTDLLPGGASNPELSNSVRYGPSMIINLQSVISVFWNDPRVYNLVSYLICGVLLLVWSVCTLRTRFSLSKAWLALAAVVPLTLIVTYHRPYDAKLLLLTVPACAMLWAEGRPTGRVALALSTAAIVSTADIPLAILLTLASNMHISTTGLPNQILAYVLMRPTPLILLAMSIFYLWIYMRRASPLDATARREDPEETPLALTQA